MVYLNRRITINILYFFYKYLKVNPRIFFYLKKLFFNRPSTLMIHPNYKCNFNCIYCYIDDKNKKVIPYKKWVSIIKEAKKLGVYSVDILGGEPFLYPNLLSLINFIVRNKMRVNIFTNGALIDEQFLEKIKNYNNKLLFIIKLDAENCYYKQNKPDITYDELIKKIKLTRHYKLNVLNFIVVTKYNYKYIDEIVNTSTKYGAFPIFERFAPVKDKKINKELELTSKEWETVLQKMFRFWKKYEHFIKFYSILNGGVCSCLSNNMAVMQNGTVKPCPEAHNDLIYGDLKKESLKEIWVKSSRLRKEFLKIPNSCNNCQSKFLCYGGCKIYTYQKTKRLDLKDPLCNSNIPTTYPHCAFPIIRLLKK